jgi:hypothetical protein
MKALKDKIQKLAVEIAQQEIEFGMKKTQTLSPAQEVFAKAIKWLVVDALAAQVGVKNGSFSVSKNKNHYKKEKPDRAGLAPLGLSYETAICDSKTEAGALNSLYNFGYLKEVSKGRYNRDGKGPIGATDKVCRHKKAIGFV